MQCSSHRGLNCFSVLCILMKCNLTHVHCCCSSKLEPYLSKKGVKSPRPLETIFLNHSLSAAFLSHNGLGFWHKLRNSGQLASVFCCSVTIDKCMLYGMVAGEGSHVWVVPSMNGKLGLGSSCLGGQHFLEGFVKSCPGFICWSKPTLSWERDTLLGESQESGSITTAPLTLLYNATSRWLEGFIASWHVYFVKDPNPQTAVYHFYSTNSMVGHRPNKFCVCWTRLIICVRKGIV